jgi:predicted GNAT superfamily acetyltransferase
VVDHGWQGRGVGRALKLGQRDYVLAATGITRMRWSYDPVRAANGHFNLDVLGARGRWFVRNLYGVDDMGRDIGHPSDRLIVDWDLTGEPSPAATGRVPSRTPGWGETTVEGDDLYIGVPRVWSFVATDHERALAIRAAVSAAFDEALAAQYVAVSCRVADDDSAWYHLRRTTASGEPGTRGGDASAATEESTAPETTARRS